MPDKQLEDILLHDMNIIKEDVLGRLRERCNEKHGKSVPGYSLCELCVSDLVGKLSDCYLYINGDFQIKDIKSELKEMYEPWVYESSPRSVPVDQNSVVHALRDARLHESYGIRVDSDWIIRRSRHYSKKVK